MTRSVPLVCGGTVALWLVVLCRSAFGATLENAPGDGQVSVSLDAYGSFGYQTFGVGTGDAVYDAAGAVGPSSTSWESAVYFRMPGASIFLTTGVIGTTGESGGLPDPGFTATGPTTASSSFTYAGLDFDLEQSLEESFTGGGGRSGSVLIQTYTIENPGPEPVSFDLVRYYEGDLFLGGVGVPDGGGHLFIGATEYVFETDEAGESATSTNFIGIAAVGGSLPPSGRYEVSEWPAFPARISADMALGDVVFGDGGDADEFVDAGSDYDVGLALANKFVLAPGEQATYVTRTLFGTGAPADVPPDLDHYLSYKIKTAREAPRFVPFGPVHLEDQFGAADYDIKKPKQLALPANKDSGGVGDEVTHLKEYQIKAVRGTPRFTRLQDIRTINQCNNLLLKVTKPISILLPTNKDLENPVAPPEDSDHNVDHFLCYNASTQRKLADGTKLPRFPKGIQVDVADQFQTRRYDLKRITKLCNPVGKSGAPLVLAGPNKGDPFPITPASIRNPASHLVCYLAKVSKKFIVQDGCGSLDPADKGTKIDPAQPRHVKLAGIHVNNQFGPEQVDTVKEAELCIPSQKILPINP